MTERRSSSKSKSTRSQARSEPKERNCPSTEWEQKTGHPLKLVVGVDEVGRGCLAGPVVAAAVVLPADFEMPVTMTDLRGDGSGEGNGGVSAETLSWLSEVNDSKLLTPERRERLAPLIREWARYSAVGVASVEEIDRLNILYASHLAMKRAIDEVARQAQAQPAHVLIDGHMKIKGLPCDCTAIVKGDQKCLSIACASVLAKVWRDQYMVELDAKVPGYGFAVHKGYPTPTHAAALESLGVTDVHRRSFAPVRKVLEGKGLFSF